MACIPSEATEVGAMRLGVLDGAVAAALAEVVDAVEAELDMLAERVHDRVMARMQVVNGRTYVAIRDAVCRAVSAGVRDGLVRMRSQAPLPQLELIPELAELARLYAGAYRELAEVADAWLLGQEVFWDHFQAVAERTLADTALCWEVIKAAQDRTSGTTARLSELFRKAYERELALVTGIDEGSDLRAVLRALDGEWVEPRELGYDLTAHHVAVVADAVPLLDDLASGTEWEVLRVGAPGGGAWGWLGAGTRISDDDIDALLASRSDTDGTVAFGEPAEGIAGFATSHRQALEARAIAKATGRSAIRFGDWRLMIAVMRDGDLAARLVERELGELDRPGERMQELRETLRSYLEHRQSVSATAALRRRDRKTIERQLRAAEELINHRVSDRSDEVLVALRVREMLRNAD